jgi:hypothetical protein
LFSRVFDFFNNFFFGKKPPVVQPDDSSITSSEETTDDSLSTASSDNSSPAIDSSFLPTASVESKTAEPFSLHNPDGTLNHNAILESLLDDLHPDRALYDDRDLLSNGRNRFPNPIPSPIGRDSIEE